MTARGICPACRFVHRLRKTGKLQAHRLYEGKTAIYCGGIGMDPITSAERLAEDVADIVEAGWNREGITAMERERRMRAFDASVERSLERRRGH